MPQERRHAPPHSPSEICTPVPLALVLAMGLIQEEGNPALGQEAGC